MRSTLRPAAPSDASTNFARCAGWADNTGFPIQKPIAPGFDPIIGQNGNNARSMSGADPKNQSAQLALPTEWVVPKGGEYFFSPSLPALKSTFAL